MARPRRMIPWLVAVVIVLIAIPVILFAIGAMWPRDHLAQVSLTVRAPVERAWALIADVPGSARWRTDVRSIAELPAADGGERWTETGSNGTTPFELVGREAPHRQVVRVVDDGLPFGGTWTWDVRADSSGTMITITEEGFIRNPVFRVMSRMLFPPTRTMEAYLRALAAELGESAEPVVVQAAHQ